jgi:hypothetical protein
MAHTHSPPPLASALAAEDLEAFFVALISSAQSGLMTGPIEIFYRLYISYFNFYLNTPERPVDAEMKAQRRIMLSQIDLLQKRNVFANVEANIIQRVKQDIQVDGNFLLKMQHDDRESLLEFISDLKTGARPVSRNQELRDVKHHRQAHQEVEEIEKQIQACGKEIEEHRKQIEENKKMREELARQLWQHDEPLLRRAHYSILAPIAIPPPKKSKLNLTLKELLLKEIDGYINSRCYDEKNLSWSSRLFRNHDLTWAKIRLAMKLRKDVSQLQDNQTIKNLLVDYLIDNRQEEAQHNKRYRIGDSDLARLLVRFCGKFESPAKSRGFSPCS